MKICSECQSEIPEPRALAIPLTKTCSKHCSDIRQSRLTRERIKAYRQRQRQEAAAL